MTTPDEKKISDFILYDKIPGIGKSASKVRALTKGIKASCANSRTYFAEEQKAVMDAVGESCTKVI